MATSDKVNVASVGAAISALFWTIAAATFWNDTFSDATIAALTGFTTTIVVFVLGMFFPDGETYLRKALGSRIGNVGLRVSADDEH
ncbi:hypothetical protein [Nocardioides ungokensis]|uniref:hypothetical protein n=1 Tax=Nocardioides ungokensis TaxID=1643322 RepID=UPI0015DF4F92|nr:hypothetical protein [Nocardioides ungokensis]